MTEIKHKKEGKGGEFFYETGGRKMAEMVYVMAGDKTMIIDHTEVDASLKGQGVGKKLLDELVNYVREHKIEVMPLCPFAKVTFERMKEWQDVLQHPAG
jgi:uncharacterized protein